MRTSGRIASARRYKIFVSSDKGWVIRGRGAPRFTFIHLISALASLDANKCI